MIFTELVIENFGAYGGKHTINLRPENKDSLHPIVLLGGMNGGGKTTLMDAIRLALYGSRARCSTRAKLGYGEFLAQSVNSQATSGELTRIELSFEDNFGGIWQQFKITRAWDRNVKEKDSLSIQREDRYDRNLEQNWDEYIENILPLGISNLFLFDGEQVKELAELDTPPPPVVEAINNLLGLELAEKLAADLTVLVNRKRKAAASKAQQLTIEEIETRLAAKKDLREEIKQEKSNLEQQLKKSRKQRDRVTAKFNKEGGKIAEERNSLKAAIERLEAELIARRQELINLTNSRLPLVLIRPLLDKAIAQGNKELKSQQLQQAKNIIEDRDNKLLNYLQNIAVTPEAIDKIQFFINTENKVIDDSIQDKAERYLNLTELQLQQLKIDRDRVGEEIDSSSKIVGEINKLKNQIDATEAQLASAASPEDYQNLLNAVGKAQKEVDKLQTLLRYTNEKIDKTDREIERIEQELNRTLKNFSEEAIDKKDDEHIINSATQAQSKLKLFKEKLTLRKLNKLETEVKDCFLYLLHKTNLINRVTIDSDRFKLELYDCEGLPFPKQRLSAGEKQLLAIAFLWGLARVSGRNLPVAIDTPLGRLDSSHRSNLIERYFPSASHQVILLSTDTEIGETEVNNLRQQEAIAREYLLKYNPQQRQTTVEAGYFF